MQQKEETRVYIMDDATLIQRCDALLASLTRDQADLAYRNVTLLVLADFENQIDAFRETDTDQEWVGILSAFVAEKDKERNELQVQISTIRNMAQNVYGRGKGLYKTFGFTDIDHLDDSNYVRAARRVHRVATSLLADLAPEGLDAAILLALITKIDELDGAIDTAHSKEEERDLATQARIVTGNGLYRTASKLAGIGKNHYFSRDEAKYNDYVLIPSTEGEDDPEPPTP